MSSIKATQIDGDVSIGRNVALGGGATVQGHSHFKGNLKVDGWLDADNIRGVNKGFFVSVDKLRSAYPFPQDGWWAVVGSTVPGPIYVADGGRWVDTGELGGTPIAAGEQIANSFLSKQDADTAKGHITFSDGLTSAKVAYLLKGFQTEEFESGYLGHGASVDENGHAELDSLFVRQFLETPELRYNRIAITQGEQWCARGGGIIEAVYTDAHRFRLKLEAGELPAVAVNDLCKGIFNTSTGFSTCFFKVLSVSAEGMVSYALRPGYDNHPTPAMHFVAYGNTTDTTRQQSAYSTTGYTRYLRGVSDWEITADNIAMQLGDLSNLSVYGLDLEGYSAYLNNVYFTGLIAQIDNAIANKQTALKRELDASIADAKAVRMPDINPDTGNWMIWDESTKTLVDSGIKAKGVDGLQGPRGLQGIQGPKGEQGIPGTNGANGKTSFFHVKYSDVPSPTASQMTELGGAYIGTYVDHTEADSNDPSKYTWVQVKGAQGDRGDQGIPGINGADGKTSYLHIAYATSADGVQGFSVSDSVGKSYIGQYTDFVPADSTDPRKYTWSLIKGEDGRNGIDWGAAKMIYTDPMFKTGTNELYHYPGADSHGGLLAHERVPTAEGNPYPSTHMMRITSTGRTLRGWGGFVFARYGTPTKANRILVARIVAKIPAGRSLVFATNPLGVDSNHRWLTPNEGTGKWEEYVYYVFAGVSAPFGTTMYFYLTGGDAPTPAAPLVWHIASATVYDATDMDAVIDEVADAKSIERYINLVETERATLEATYAKVYALPLLIGTPKTTLLNANTTYKGAADNLLAAVRAAIGGGYTTTTQKADVDRKFTAYKTALTSLRVALEEGERAAVDAATQNSLALAKYRGGKMLYTDPTFANGDNGIRPYGSTDTSVLSVERIPKGEGNPYPSAHMMRITSKGISGMGWGGWTFSTPTKANQILVARIVAKIPAGRSIVFATNNVGDGRAHRWLTPNGGTNKWEEYVYLVQTGASGTFSTTMFFYLTGGDAPTPAAPLVWYVAYATVYDATDLDDVQPTHLLPMPHDPTVTYVGGSTYAAVVYDAAGLWYKAVKDVPANTPLTNRNYWQPISSMGAVGMQEAYVRSLWANQAFIDRLHAESITAQSIRAGANPNAPQGYNAVIDNQGYGHLLGGSLRFDAGGMHLGAFDVDNGRVTIKDEAGKDRVIYSNDATPELSVVSASSTFTGPIQERTLTDANISFVLRGTSAEALPSDYPFRFVGDGRTPWRHWRGTGEHSSLLHSGARPDTTLDFSLQLSMTVLQGEMYGCIAEVYLINPVLGHRKVATWTYAGNSTHTQRIQVPNMPQGGYQIRVVYDMGVRNVYDEPPVVSCRVKVLPGGSAYSNPKGYRCIAYHNNGWFIAYPDLLMYMSEQEGLHLTGKTNLPGVLCAARIDTRMTADYKWGKFANEVQNGKELKAPGVYRANDGTYTIRHGISHANYVPTVTPQNSGGAMVDMIAVSPYSFTFKMYNRHGSVIASAFHFQCVGSNG